MQHNCVARVIAHVRDDGQAQGLASSGLRTSIADLLSMVTCHRQSNASTSMQGCSCARVCHPECAAGKVKQTSAQKRARKAEVAQMQSQAKYAWAALGAILVLVLIIIVGLSSSKKAKTEA